MRQKRVCFYESSYAWQFRSPDGEVVVVVQEQIRRLPRTLIQLVSTLISSV